MRKRTPLRGKHWSWTRTWLVPTQSWAIPRRCWGSGTLREERLSSRRLLNSIPTMPQPTNGTQDKLAALAAGNKKPSCPFGRRASTISLRFFERRDALLDDHAGAVRSTLKASTSGFTRDPSAGLAQELVISRWVPPLSPRLISTDHHASGRNARRHSAMG